jgi:hypothetical protein
MNVVFNDSIRLYKDGHQKSFLRINHHPQFFVISLVKFDRGNNIEVSKSWSCKLARGTETSSNASLNYNYGELRLQERLQ